MCCCLAALAEGQDAVNESIRNQMVKDWERAKSFTLEYLEVMPADQYKFKANDSIRSFAAQMLHLAQGTVSLTSNGSGAPRIFPGYLLERSESAQSKDSVTYYVKAAYDFAISSIRNMDMSRLWEIVKRGNFEETRYAWLQKAFEHQTHHRGQTTIYIRLLNLRPPNERLF